MRSYWSRRNDYFYFLESGGFEGWHFLGWVGGGSAKRIVFCPQWWGFHRISIYFPCIFDEFSKSSIVEVIWDLVYPGRGRTATFLCGNVQVFQRKGLRQVLFSICLTLCWLKWRYFISHCSFSRQYTTIHSCMGRCSWKRLVLTTAFAYEKVAGIWPLPTWSFTGGAIGKRERDCRESQWFVWLLCSFPMFLKHGICGIWQFQFWGDAFFP